MAITPNFTASVNYSTNTILNLLDTSSGSDGAINSRRVTLQLDNGSYLILNGLTTTSIVDARFAWSYSVSFLDLDVLNKDYALAIKVEWLNVSNVVLYTKIQEFPFTSNAHFFQYKLSQFQRSNPSIINSQDFFLNKIKLIVAIDDAENAITWGSDLATSQAAIDETVYLENNQNYFY